MKFRPARVQKRIFSATNANFHLPPLFHLSLSCVKYISESPLPLPCALFSLALSFIHNPEFCHLIPDALLPLQLSLSNLPLHPLSPRIVSLFSFIGPFLFFFSTLSPPLSISARPRVSAEGNAVWLQIKLNQLGGLVFQYLQPCIICIIC